jgi:putative IMPACT (imprinted ancient) family translation regulator
MMTGPVEMTPQELESSLALPVCLDEERISRTVLQTNRAPLVLAFAVELIRYTMPDQPPSSRLSLAQAVVSANSRSKAVSIGIEKGLSADDEGWGHGQPRIRVMGRDIAVLKRGGYEWKGDETVADENGSKQDDTQTQDTSTTATVEPPSTGAWTVSQPLSLKKSTFIARAAHMADASQRPALMRGLMEANPNLKTASHNAWAFRLRPPATGGRAREESFDDGETGCGDLMLRIMREVDAADTLVVLSRWFGGVLLGPDRWRLMRNCVTGALAERLRKTGSQVAVGQEAVWGLDLEAMRSKSAAAAYGAVSAGRHDVTGIVGMQIHRPEAARSYLLKSFASGPEIALPGEAGHEAAEASPERSKKPQKKTQKAINEEKEENLGLLLGAIRLLFDSWADHLTAADLDRRAWSWYVAVRPEVESGPSGWGAKGLLKLEDILKLRRNEGG